MDLRSFFYQHAYTQILQIACIVVANLIQVESILAAGSQFGSEVPVLMLDYN